MAKEKNEKTDGALKKLQKDITELKSEVGDVLRAVNNFASATEKRFQSVEDRLDKLDDLDGRVSNLEKNMVTKDYLDDRMADLRGDIIQLVRKEDRKFASLVYLLEDKEIITEDEGAKLLSQEPFPLGQ